MSKQGSSQILSQRYALVFKQVVRFYETKMYKKGLRAADQILKANPDHGETLAMKGLILNCMGPEQQSQALPMIKRGLLSHMQSHICWHVLGLYHRAAREYAQAIKAYLRALHIDADNIQILRDLSLLQVQIRDLSGYEETRRRILVLQPAGRHNWLAYSVAAYLGGHRQRSLDILTAYRKTLDQDRSYEYGEMIMFQLRIMIDEGLLEEALRFAQESRQYVVDLNNFHEIEAELLLTLGRKDEARQLYRQLIDCNPDQTKYHSGWRKASDLDSKSLLSAYDEFVIAYPDANLPRLLPLDLISDMSLFTEYADAYLRDGFSRGIPSLFRCMRQFYGHPMKRDIISKLIVKYSNEEPISPSTLVVYAQHMDFVQEHAEALNIIDRALELSGEIDRSSIDMLLLKGRILKHMGAHSQAYSILNQARCLDLQDRFLNTKTVKYALRAGLLSEAQNIVSLFLRDGDTIISLFDMQCMWYELALGEAHARLGSFGAALNRFYQIETHFNDIADDQFDFHMYCLRRQTLSVYISMLKWEDNLFSHRFAVRASINAVRLLLKIHQRSLSSDAHNADRAESDASKAPKKSANAPKNASKDRKDVAADEEDLSLLQNGKALERARQFVRRLAIYAPSTMETYILSASLHTYMNLPLLVLHALLQAVQLPDALKDFSYQKASLTFTLNHTPSDDMIGQVISSEMPLLFPSTFTSASAYAESLICTYSKSSNYDDRVHAADLMSLTGTSSDLIRSQLMSFESGDKPALSSLLRAKALVDERYYSLSPEFNAKAALLYPLADDFQS